MKEALRFFDDLPFTPLSLSALSELASEPLMGYRVEFGSLRDVNVTLRLPAWLLRLARVTCVTLPVMMLPAGITTTPRT